MPDVLMPRLSDTMEEGTLSQWVKHEGDEVRRGEVVAVIETDKAAMDLEAYDDGVLTRILVEEGASVPIGTPIAVIGDGAQAARRPAVQPTTVQPTTAQPSAGEPFLGEPSPPEPLEPSPRQTVPPRPSPAEPVPPPPPEPVPQPPPGPVPPVPPEPVPPPPPPPPAPPSPAPPAGAQPGAGRPSPAGRGAVLTSPLARTLARRHGIDLAGIPGTGPGGRIVRADVEDAVRRQQARPAPGVAPGAALPVAAAPAVTPAPAAVPAPASRQAFDAQPDEVTEVPLSRVRRITAERLTLSTQQAPHFYLTRTADVAKLLEFRAGLGARPGAATKISVTDLLVKACAVVLARHPEVNSSWGGTVIRRHRRVHVGVAVAIEDGLIVPVIRDADRKTLTEVAVQAHELAEKARARRLSPDEFTGGTFTISNLGMYGIDHFTAVINPPEAAILAVGAITRVPVARGEQIAMGTTMTLTLSIDHRVVDGATGARFLGDLVALLEDPLSIVV